MLDVKAFSSIVMLSLLMNSGLASFATQAHARIASPLPLRDTPNQIKLFDSEPMEISPTSPTPNLADSIAACEAIVVRLNQALEVDLGQLSATPLPIMVYLSQPVRDGSGRTILPVGTAVQVQMVRSPDSVRFITESILVNHQLFVFAAASLPIPIRRVETPLNPNSPLFSLRMLGVALALVVKGGMTSGQAAGQATAALLTLLLSSEATMVSIPANIELILSRALQ